MDRTFTKDEFHDIVFKSDALDKGFLKQWINKYCIRYCKDVTPLQWAAHKGYVDIVKYLVENGANITADNNRAVQWAAYEGHLDVIKYLVENDVNVIFNDNYAIRWAASYGHLEVVKYLVENGADIIAGEKCAIQLAAIYDHIDVIKYLLSTYIYSEEFIHSYAKYHMAEYDTIKEIMLNYKQFLNTKACR